ncbi:xylose operon transcription regulator XylR [Alienimonas chondri]|uniref:Xylose operon regulatory protein n=1 Tax=Alienimonas chondri TaxID=2681879 RepID=A0ABX1V8P7_9PLAN|nr:DNA-binding transcriptional regulator [Alienimonas chondri]NNJ24277.1 Xylose operon regulatory protein [Alienimonas chondri]
MSSTRRPSVALLIETSNAYARGVLDGITQWQREHEAWSVYLPEQERGAPPPGWFAEWDGDGVIARVETDAIAQVLAGAGVPVVDVSAGRLLPGAPCVETDNPAIAEAAFEHLAERGFQSFGYCGDPRFRWSNERRDRFVELAAEAGFPCRAFDTSVLGEADRSWTEERRRLRDWVRDLPRPAGVFACYDIRAQQVLDVCRGLDIAVPEEIAVLGADNDRLLCDLTSPPLSSVICDARRIGYEAAAMLARKMAGEAVPPDAVFVGPVGVETRQSTDTLAIEDPDVAAAVRFIRERAATGINVKDVLRTVPLSRRVLEDRFQSLLGRTPHEEIARVRLARVKRLLLGTDLPIAEIAYRTGFGSAAYLSAAFRKSVGVSPRAFRKDGEPAD